MKFLRATKHFPLLFFFSVLLSSNALAKVSVHPDAFQNGLTALRESRYADALDDFTTAEHEHPDDARVRNFRGIALTRLARNTEAAAEYKEAIRLDPRIEDACRNLGFLEWTEHQLDSARQALQRAVELSPSDSFAHYYLGRVELESQHYAEAVYELDISKVPPPADADFSIQMATAYIALRRQEDASKSLDYLITLPLNDRQSIQSASLLLAVHRNDAAITLIQQLSRHPSATGATWENFDLALVYLLAGSYEKAAEQARFYGESMSPAALKSPQSAPTWSLIGIASAHLRQVDQSVNALRQAAILAPGEEEHWLNLTRELMELSRYSETISAVQDGLAANPRSYALRLRLGAAHLAAGHYAEAESVFRDLVAAGDPLPTGYVGLAQVLLRTGRAEEAALELADASKTLGPNFLLSYFRGLALDRAGKPLEASAAFQDAVKLDGNNSEAHLSLGKTELTLGHASEAIIELQQALRLSPGNVQAQRLLSQAYRRAHDPKSAAEFAEASADAHPVPEGDLLGDFFVPHWQVPSESSKQ
jgi:Flp pilus assembly protein TadD